MSSSNHKQLSYIFTFFILIASLVITYSLSQGSALERTHEVPSQTSSTGLLSASKITEDNILLVKNDKLVIGKTCLEFVGLKKKSVLIDLYLLDFDDELPFTKKIRHGETKRQIRLGDNTYRMVSAGDDYVRLKLLDIFETP